MIICDDHMSTWSTLLAACTMPYPCSPARASRARHGVQGFGMLAALQVRVAVALFVV
jgi:hypothetical protein